MTMTKSKRRPTSAAWAEMEGAPVPAPSPARLLILASFPIAWALIVRLVPVAWSLILGAR